MTYASGALHRFGHVLQVISRAASAACFASGGAVVLGSLNVSERTLTKAALAERWALWMALGEELFGESYAEWEEARLQRIIEEAERAQEGIRRLRTRAALLAERAVDVDDSLRREGPGDVRTG